MDTNNTGTPHRQATDAFIAQTLPNWLKNASFNQFQALRSSFENHLRSQQQVQRAFAALQPLDSFAKSLLSQALLSSLSLSVDLGKAQWREEHRHLRADADGPQDHSSYFVRAPALQTFLHNFKPNESFFQQTALVYPADPATGQAEQVLCSDSAQLVELCRNVDVGKQYRQHLDAVLTPTLLSTLTEDKRLQLALATEVAALKGQLPAADIDMLRRIVNGNPPTHAISDRVHAGTLNVLGYRIEGALAFELQAYTPIPGRLPRVKVEGVILYLPGDHQQSLRAYRDWGNASLGLGTLLRETGYRRAFNQRVALTDRAGYLALLGRRLADSQTDASATSEVIHDPLFQVLAEQHVQRIRDNAQFLAVPTDKVNERARAEQLQTLQALGTTLLNLAGLFVPVIGAVLTAELVGQTVSQVCEGVWDWSQGHQHEAIEHLLGVAETVVVGAVVAGGAAVVARGFSRSALVDRLMPIENDAGQPRLWSGDLAPYADGAPPDDLLELDNGLLTNGSGHWWRNGETYYRVRPVAGRSVWQLRHPQREASFGPLLEFNDERCWRLSNEQPIEWQGSSLLLGRLWPPAAQLGDERIEQILKVADVDQDYLRGLLVEGRPLPVQLRDTLERFAVDARVNAFIEQLAEGREDDSELFQWCIDRLKLDSLSIDEQRAEFVADAQDLREQMFEHLSRRYLAEEPLKALLQRDFKGLPDAYAVDVLKRATDTQRQRMLSEQRIPLAIAEQARGQLQLAQLTRMREGLYLRNSYQPGTVGLVFALLRQHAHLSGTVDLQLREGSDSGRVLAQLYPDSHPETATTILVRREGIFKCYDLEGREQNILLDDPEDLAEVLLRHLANTDLTRLKWQGAEARSQLLGDLRAWLPAGRKPLLELTGLSEIRPPYTPLRRLPDGRVGYPLSGRGQGSHPSRRALIDAVRVLYPTLGARALDNFVNHLMESPQTAYISLIRQYREFRQLDEALHTWHGQAQGGSLAGGRRVFGDELRRSWRLEGRQLVTLSGERAGSRLSLVGVNIRTLPTLPANTDFSHVSDLILVGLHLEAIPAGFLRCFSRLRWLNLSNNGLSSVPDDIVQMTGLTTLRMAHNQIRMTQSAADALAGLSRLHTLDMSFNPLGSISLQFRQLSPLRELNLRRANLRAIPAGLEWCGLLELADLRDNQIAVIPDALLNAPQQTRRALELRNNPVPQALLDRLVEPAPAPVELPSAVVVQTQARAAWLDTVEPSLRGDRAGQWDALQAEPNSEELFRLLGQLTETSDYRQARQDLSRRVWLLIEAATNDQTLRTKVFDLAGARGCADRLIACFSSLEVCMLVAQAQRAGGVANQQASLLELARGLFRLEEVERIARQDIERRVTLEMDRLIAANRPVNEAAVRAGIDEVEVSLAYRVGLARTLGLPGQPRTMQFERLAGVTQQQLGNAAAAVRWASSSDALAKYISQRDFWIAYLEQSHADQFESAGQPFWDQEEALHDLPEGERLIRSNQIANAYKAAKDKLILVLTREALHNWDVVD